jgi:hypothetical protein
VLAIDVEIGFEVDARGVQSDWHQQPAARPRVSRAVFPEPSARAGGQPLRPARSAAAGRDCRSSIGVAHGPCVFNIEQQTLLRRG